jgi:hypothetical protein
MVNTQRILSTLAVAAVCVVAAAAPAQARVEVTPGPWCGGTLWKLMTLSDKGRSTVKWTPAATSVSDIAKLVAPATAPSTRGTPFQKQVWQLSVVVDRYRVASNGEIVLVLFDIPSATYMDAYLPNPKCLSSSSRGRADMIAARAAFLKCPAPTVGWQQNGVSVVLSGVGFWNPAKSTKGALPNGAEIRPVTSLKIVSGCGI